MEVGEAALHGAIVFVEAIFSNRCIIHANCFRQHYGIVADFSSLSAVTITSGSFNLRKYFVIALGVTILYCSLVGENVVVSRVALSNKIWRVIACITICLKSPRERLRERWELMFKKRS